jgi:hypothetical protein
MIDIQQSAFERTVPGMYLTIAWAPHRATSACPAVDLRTSRGDDTLYGPTKVIKKCFSSVCQNGHSIRPLLYFNKILAGTDKHLDDTTAIGWSGISDSASPSVSEGHDTPMNSLFSTNDGTPSHEEETLPDTEPFETSFPSSSLDYPSNATFKEDASRDISSWAMDCLPTAPMADDTWSAVNNPTARLGSHLTCVVCS